MPENTRQLLKRFMAFYRPHRRLFTLDLVTAALRSLLTISIPFLVVRMLDREHSSLVRGRSRTKMVVAFDISVENLSDTGATLTVADRIPVSENKDIKVRGVDIEPNAP